MNFKDLANAQLNGYNAIRATLNGQVVWSGEEPVVGTVYTEDFESYDVGMTLGAVFSSPWASVTRQIVSVEGEKALRIRATSNGSRCAFTYNAVDSDPERANCSLFIQMRTTVDGSSPFAPVRLMGRVNGATGTEAGIAGGPALGGSIRIDQYNGGTYSALNNASFNHSNVKMNMLMRIHGTTATLKAWVEGSPEPQNPQVTSTIGVTATGGVGLFVFNNNDVDVLFMSIATGDAEPDRKPEFVEAGDPEGFSAETELAARTNNSSVDQSLASIEPPPVLTYQDITNGWGYYFAVLENAQGFARNLEIQNASSAGGLVSTAAHVAVWSADPHSDNWEPIPYQGTVNNRLTFAQTLPDDQEAIAVGRVPGYTVTRVYAKTEEYRQSQYVLVAPSAPDGNYGVQVSPSDWRGQPVPDLDMPAYRIGDGVQTGKNIVVLVAGNHPYEVHADYNLEGSVEFLLSQDPVAALLREWCDVFVYPTINPAGRWCGYSRANPELKAAGLHDHNRIWGSSNRDTTSKLKAAWQADFGQQCDFLIDYHTFFFDQSSNLRGIWAPDGASNSAYMSRYGVREPDNFNNRLVGSTSSINTLPEYAMQSMGATVSVHSEESPLASRNVPHYRASGEALMRALWDMIYDGLMPHGPA